MEGLAVVVNGTVKENGRDEDVVSYVRHIPVCRISNMKCVTKLV